VPNFLLLTRDSVRRLTACLPWLIGVVCRLGIARKRLRLQKRLLRPRSNELRRRESALSTKRKVAEDTAQDDVSMTTPTKKFRAGDTMSTPPPQQQALFSTTPKNNPPASNTSNLFGSIIKSAPVSTPTIPASSIFANAEPKAATNNTPSLGFQVPAFGKERYHLTAGIPIW
jgi:hypothetical protein